MRRSMCCSVVALLSLACAPPSVSSGGEEDAAAITRATEQWAAAYERGDIERATAFVTREARFVPPNQPVVSGAAAIEAWNRHLLAELSFENIVSTVDSLLVAGDWAVSRGQWVITFSTDGTAVTDTSRYVAIWERQADGSWKVAHDIWNTALPMPGSQAADGG